MTPLLAPLSSAERRDWLRLVRSEGIGPRTFLGLLQRFGTAAAIIDAFPHLRRRRADLRLAATDTIDAEIEAVDRKGLTIVGLFEPGYPPALRRIDSPPPLITVRGRLSVLQAPMAAIVGSRNASAPGSIFAERLARELGDAGFVIASGLARGIDAKAHRGSLKTGTVAVLAGGHDRIYPPDHVGLAEAIAETGAVVSEMPLGWVPRGRDFPRRNRIVSGLALGTVVVEAARQSGSLITARLAAEQGREVFAVPGSPLDPRAEGTNDLLRNGATLCARAEDVIEVLRAQIDRPPLQPPQAELWAQGEIVWEYDAEPEPGVDDDDELPSANPGHSPVEDLLGLAPVAFDDLVRLTGRSAADLRIELFDLELDGRIAWTPGGGVAKASP